MLRLGPSFSATAQTSDSWLSVTGRSVFEVSVTAKHHPLPSVSAAVVTVKNASRRRRSRWLSSSLWHGSWSWSTTHSVRSSSAELSSCWWPGRSLWWRSLFSKVCMYSAHWCSTICLPVCCHLSAQILRVFCADSVQISRFSTDLHRTHAEHVQKHIWTHPEHLHPPSFVLNRLPIQHSC